MIFIDTGAFVARWLSSDQHHLDSLAAWKRLADAPTRLLTSQHVLDETLTLLSRRADGSFATEKGRILLASRALEVLPTPPEVVYDALKILDRYSDLRLSFTDCLSFVLMEKHGIRLAFTFDHHFRIAGYEVWPDDAR